MSAGGESKGSSGSGGGGGESKHGPILYGAPEAGGEKKEKKEKAGNKWRRFSKVLVKNERGMRQASNPWGEKWVSNPQTIADKHVLQPSLRQRTIPLRHGEWLGPRRALHLAKRLAPYSSRRRDKDDQYTIRIGASNENVALMHEGHKQLAALNNRKSAPSSRGIGKLTKELQKAKKDRPLGFRPLVRSTCRFCYGTGRNEGSPADVRDVRDNELRKNIRAIGRARKRTKRYNKVLKATRGRLPGGYHVPPRASKTIAEFATGAGNYSTKSTKSGGRPRTPTGSTKSSGRWFEAGRKKKRRTRRKKHRRTKRRRRRRTTRRKR